MAYKKLSEVSSYVSEKISNALLTVDNFIGVDNMLPNCNGITHATYKPEMGNSTRFRVNDILIGNIRPYFKKIWLANFDGGCSADVLVIRCNDHSHAPFIYAALATDAFFKYNMAGSKGSKMPRGDKNHIMNYQINFVNDFENIGSILNSIDEQIQRNNAMVHKLQVLGQAIFANIMHNTTTTVTLGKIAEMYQPGTITSDKFVVNGKYPVYGAGGIIGLYNTYNHENPALMVSCRGVCGQVDISLPRSFIIGNQMIVKPYDDKMFYFLYHYFKSCDLSAIETGSVQKQITRANLSKLEICLPEKCCIDENYSTFAYLHQQQQRIYQITQRLMQVKNRILPMLMNEQITG